MIRPSLGFRARIAVLVALPVAVVVTAAVPLLATLVDGLRAAQERDHATAVAAAVAPLLADLGRERVASLDATGPGRDGRDPAALLLAQARSRDAAALARGSAGLPPPALDGLRGLDAVRRDVVAGAARPDAVAAAFVTAGDAVAAAVDVPASGEAGPLLAANQGQADAEAALLQVALDPGTATDAAASAAAAAAEAAVRRAAVDPELPAEVVRAAAAAPAQRRAGTELAGLGRDGVAPPGPVLDTAATVAAAAAGRDLLAAQVVARQQARVRADLVASRVAAVAVGTVLLTVALLVVVTGLRIGRSVARPLARLAAAADTVARIAHDELRRATDDAGDDPDAPTLAAVNIDARDEIGELAASFNRVQAATALLLERQVQMRRTTARLLGDTGRRTRSLVGRQLGLVDALERSEQDPERLDRLYRLDHLTSRLRRRADSLLVLARADEPEPLAQPQPLLAVLRTALASVEGYRRIEIADVPGAVVRPDMCGEVALLLAELLENAVTFSPPDTTVDVRAHADARGCRVDIVDRGVGLPPDALERHNARLGRQERLEQVEADRLGLVVVGRIARRRGLDVTLHPTPGGGLTAVVGLPPAVAAVPVASTPAGPDRGVAAGQRRSGPGGDPRPGTSPARDRAVAPPPSSPAAGRDRAAPRRNGHAVAARPARAVVLRADGAGAPPGAAGLPRRVRDATSLPAADAPRLKVFTDAAGARAWVDDLESGIARAVADTRAVREAAEEEP